MLRVRLYKQNNFSAVLMVPFFLAQLGATSQTKALQINKGSDTAPGIDYNTVSVKTASEAPRPGQVCGSYFCLFEIISL